MKLFSVGFKNRDGITWKTISGDSKRDVKKKISQGEHTGTVISIAEVK